MRRALLALGLVTAAAAVLVATYLALGGGAYKPLEPADPCEPRRLVPAEPRGRLRADRPVRARRGRLPAAGHP